MNPTVSGPPKIPAGRRSSHSPRPAPGARPVPCPYCGTTNRVRQTSDTGHIQAWACDHCDTDWAFTVPNSRATAALPGDLGAVAQEIRWLRWALARWSRWPVRCPKLTDVELRARLLALAESDARCRPPGAARPGGLLRRWILAWRRARRAIGCGG
ncbi:MAG: hypothetical protein WBF76_01875 [Pseudonocardiaceae bacterium]